MVKYLGPEADIRSMLLAKISTPNGEMVYRIILRSLTNDMKMSKIHRNQRAQVDARVIEELEDQALVTEFDVIDLTPFWE